LFLLYLTSFVYFLKYITQKDKVRHQQQSQVSHPSQQSQHHRTSRNAVESVPMSNDIEEAVVKHLSENDDMIEAYLHPTIHRLEHDEKGRK
jgi:flagellar biosynthesis component FlhA